MASVLFRLIQRKPRHAYLLRITSGTLPGLYRDTIFTFHVNTLNYSWQKPGDKRRS
jgi:hypothetical protein